MFQLEQFPAKGLYFQAVGRMGDMHNSWKTNDLAERISYDTENFYYGICTGLGFKGQFSDHVGFDVYGKFFWTHQEGDKANLNGERFKFQDVDSLKTRLGARVNYNGFQAVKPFVGMAWEKEYDGKAAATVNGYRINEPELKGDSCLLECGLKYSPDTEACWHLDFTVAGYVGDRRGVNGQTRVVWNF